MEGAADSQRRALRGVLLMVAAVGVFSLMDTVAKYLTRFYPVPVVVWLRFSMNLAVLLVFLAARGELGRLVPRRPGLQVTRGLLLAGATIFFVGSLSMMPIAEAAAIGFVMPLFLAVLAVPMLGERMDVARIAAVLAGLAGALVIVRPGAEAFTPWALLPVGMALCNALYQIYTRKLAGVDHALTSLVWGAIVGTVVFSAVLPFYWVAPANPWHWLAFGAIGVLASVGHFILIRAYDYASATTLSPFFYTQLVWVMLLGWIVFGEFPDGWSLLGMGIIVVAGLSLVGRQRLTVRRT
jgi:drug/metabolite transporter (DMT)-like permease